jgi:hypothetical protein
MPSPVLTAKELPWPPKVHTPGAHSAQAFFIIKILVTPIALKLSDF